MLVTKEVLWWQKEGRLHGSGPFVLEIHSNGAAGASWHQIQSQLDREAENKKQINKQTKTCTFIVRNPGSPGVWLISVICVHLVSCAPNEQPMVRTPVRLRCLMIYKSLKVWRIWTDKINWALVNKPIFVQSLILYQQRLWIIESWTEQKHVCTGITSLLLNVCVCVCMMG